MDSRYGASLASENVSGVGSMKPYIYKEIRPLKQKIDGRTFYFGWHKTIDSRDHRGLRAFEALRKTDFTLRDRSWRIGPILDQSTTPKCVGYSTKGTLNAAPDPEYTKAGGKLHPQGKLLTPEDIYKLAQDNDEWPGSDYEGSSGRGAMKGLQGIGVIGEYIQPSNMEELLAHLCNVGPVLLGSDFSESMCYPDVRGYVYNDKNYIGGHEYYAHKYDKSSKRITIANSWGTSWGLKGQFSIHRDALDELIFGGNGECWTFVKKG